MNMRKIMNWVLAAIITCGASVFTSCTVSDNPAQPAEPDLNVAEKIIGKWMIAERDGQPALTNEKEVFNFISTTEAYLSASLNFHPDAATPWYDIIEADVVIEGNKVTLTMHPDEHTISVREFTITAINENEFTANHEVTVTKDGNIVLNEKVLLTLAKVKVDYSADIIGMWEGMSTGAEGSEFDDGENHRWEYLLDGTFNYFHKNDQWQISDDDFSDYFVAGNLLCTRWKNAGEGNEEHREWWEIESIENGVMKWKALRQREDGSTYTATFEMKKIELSPSDYKCSRVEVIYRITSPKTNYTFFEGKYAVKSGSDVKIDKLPTFTTGYHEAYNVTDITTFPVEEAICLHYGIKDGLESYADVFSLNWEMSYTVTSYNADGYKLDSQTISDRYGATGKGDKEDLEMVEKMSYSELHASVAEDGMITLSKVNKMHPEKSGIDW